MLNSTQIAQTTDWINKVLNTTQAPIGAELNRILSNGDDFSRDTFANWPLSRQLQNIHANKQHDFTGTSAVSGKQFTITAFTPKTLSLLESLIQAQLRVEEAVESAQVDLILDEKPDFL